MSAEPAAISAFEAQVKEAGFYIESRGFLMDDDDNPHYWHYLVSKKSGEQFPCVAVIPFQYEDDEQMGAQAAKDAIETLRRRA